jgi:hypothetical protein
LQRGELEREVIARQIWRMYIHGARGSLICALVLVMPVLSLARADQAAVAAPNDPASSCEKMMDNAMAMLLKMPPGVEKMAAQKELLSAKVDIDKGDMAGCKTHVNNAMGAMMAHNPG